MHHYGFWMVEIVLHTLKCMNICPPQHLGVVPKLGINILMGVTHWQKVSTYLKKKYIVFWSALK